MSKGSGSTALGVLIIILSTGDSDYWISMSNLIDTLLVGTMVTMLVAGTTLPMCCTSVPIFKQVTQNSCHSAITVSAIKNRPTILIHPGRGGGGVYHKRVKNNTRSSITGPAAVGIYTHQDTSPMASQTPSQVILGKPFLIFRTAFVK